MVQSSTWVLGTLTSGPATKKLMERACEVFGERRYEHQRGSNCQTELIGPFDSG